MRPTNYAHTFTYSHDTTQIDMSGVSASVDVDIEDDEKLDHDSLAIPKLHAKYLRLYNNFTTLRDQAELDVKRTYRDRWEYYTGKSEKPFPMKLIKTDVAIYLEADKK